MRNKLLKSFLIFFILAFLLPAALPTRKKVADLTERLLTRIDSKISTTQKNKILEYAKGYSSSDNSCPGYKFEKGIAHVKTTNKGGAFLQAGFEAVFKGKIKVAEWCFLKAVKINPDCPVFLSNTAFTLNYLGNYKDALTFLNYAILLDPSYPSVWVNIGYAQKNLGNYKDAKKAYQIAIGLNPEIEDYRKALLNIYEKSGDKKSSDTAKLDKALDILNRRKQQRSGTNPSGGTVPSRSYQDRNLTRDEQTLLSKMGSNYNSDMQVLGRFIPGLSYAAGQFLREAEWHRKKAAQEHEVLKTEHELGAKAWGAMAFLCRGYIADITGSWDKSGEIVGDAFNRIPHRPEDYNPIKGMRPEWKMPPLSIGFDGLSFSIDPNDPTGAIKFSIGEGVILGFSAGKKGWGVKIGVGLKAEAGAVGASGGYFIKYDSIKGLGNEAKGSVSCAGVKVSMPVYSHSFSFENL